MPGRRAPGAQERTELVTLPKDGALMLGQLWRRFAFFRGGAFGFADGDHEFGLPTSELTPARGPAMAPDLGEVLAHFGGKGKPLGSH